MGEPFNTDKNGIVNMQNRSNVLLVVFLLSLIFNLFINWNVFGQEIANFHVILKDINLLNFDSLLKKYAPQIKYGGDISLESDLKIEQGNVVIANGDFSSGELSLSGGNLSMPFDLSNLEGTFEFKLTGGKPAVKGNIKSATGQWGRLHFQNLKADYSFFGNKLNISKCELKLAEGVIYINGDVDFTKNHPFFDIKLTAEGVNIGSISAELGYTKPLSGRLFADATLSGEWADPTTFLGEAKLKIEDGDLGKMGLISRLITFSPLATISKDITLNNMEGDFLISEGYASTEDTILTGPGMKITAKGNAGWNKKLDFILNFYASSESLKGATIMKILGAIVDNLGNVLRRVKLTGTVDNPVFTIVPIGIAGTITEGIEKSFKNIAPGENIQ